MAALQSVLLCLLLVSIASSSTPRPKPTDDILSWTKLEIGMMYSYGMISTMTSTDNTNYFCVSSEGGGGPLPPPSTFNPTKIDLDNWLDAAVAIGARYAVLVAQHCGGFSTWPTDVANATDGFEYKYSIKFSPLKNGKYDLVQEFIDSCKRHNVLPAIYYGLNENYYLNVGRGKVLGPPAVSGQGNVTQDMYGRIVLAQMKELWGNYGKLAEIWFDGGCSVPGISDNISSLLATLQPHAVYFGGCASNNNLRWVGTESGRPGYPLWSTTSGSAGGCSPGLGSADGNTFCPAESDTTLHSSGQWFWRPSIGIKSLDDLKTTYYKTVGQNTNLLLNAAPNSDGLIEEESMTRYKEFGDWIKACFGKPVISTSGNGNIIKLISAAGQPFHFNKIVLQEDQTNGEAVTQYSIYNPSYNGTTTPIYSGQSIGNKAIINFDPTPWPSHELVLNITQSFMEPVIVHFGAYNCME